jgi:hypothetical protein
MSRFNPKDSSVDNSMDTVDLEQAVFPSSLSVGMSKDVFLFPENFTVERLPDVSSLRQYIFNSSDGTRYSLSQQGTTAQEGKHRFSVVKEIGEVGLNYTIEDIELLGKRFILQYSEWI